MSGRAPWRWRKAKPPAFSQFSQPAMASMQWHRDNGRDIELVRGGVHFATVSPSGSWSGWSRGFDAHGQGQGERASGKSSDVDAAKADCRAAIERLQSVAPVFHEEAKR